MQWTNRLRDKRIPLIASQSRKNDKLCPCVGRTRRSCRVNAQLAEWSGTIDRIRPEISTAFVYKDNRIGGPCVDVGGDVRRLESKKGDRPGLRKLEPRHLVSYRILHAGRKRGRQATRRPSFGCRSRRKEAQTKKIKPWRTQRVRASSLRLLQLFPGSSTLDGWTGDKIKIVQEKFSGVAVSAEIFLQFRTCQGNGGWATF